MIKVPFLREAFGRLGLTALVSLLVGASLLGCQLLESGADTTVTEEELRGRWQITSLAGSPVQPNSRAYLEFSDSPRLTGNGGCNRFFGVYHYDNEVLEISSAMGSTRMACAADTMAQEQHLFQLIPDAVHAEWRKLTKPEPAELLLRDENGRELLTAVRKLKGRR